MKTFKSLITPVVTLALLAGCEHRLTPSLQREISLESDRLQNAERQVKQSEAALNSNLASAPGLFSGTPEPSAWKANISEAKADLQASKLDGLQLTKLAERNPSDHAVTQLLADERRLREAALQKAQSVDRASAKWLDYQRDPAAFVAKINRERDAVRSIDLAPVITTVHKAEQDWPAKKPALESRLATLVASKPAEIRKAGESTAQTPSVLIAEEDALSRQATSLSADVQELQNASGQLYDSWDKILTDLDRSQLGGDTIYRERLKTVRTHLIDVPSKKTETNSSEHWMDVSEGSFRSVENDIGMAVAHKDAGVFDSEAQNVPQPPGFSYVASPSVGSNQYGYWNHNGGQSVWTFLPEYLILREMLWSRDYRPVMATEYNAYRLAQGRGTTYYGRETPTAAPRYGTHGTFTKTHYADSRYVQSGGFKGSAYASDRGSSGSSWTNRLRPTPPAGQGVASEGGKRFGRQPSSAPMGERFGRSPGPRPMGRSFGRRR